MHCNPSDINQTFIIEPPSLTGGTPIVSACTAVYTNAIVSCDDNAEIILSVDTIFNTNLIPTGDTTISIGTPVNRFRDVNSVSGHSTYWTSTTSVTTANLELGLDSSGNNRTITADNSIIQNDILLGGNY